VGDGASFDFLPFWLGLAWIVAVIGGSVLFRSTRGKPIVPRAPADSLFVERWTSGRSLDTPWGRLGGASNCLMVAVTPREVIVVPHFPFCLMFLPEIYGLELAAPRAAVRVEKTDAGWFGGRVILAIEGAKPKQIEIGLRNKAEFFAALDRDKLPARR